MDAFYRIARLTNRIQARPPQVVDAAPLTTDPAIVRSFLSDAAHVPGGFAAGVTFPTNEDQVAALIRSAARVLPVGAQSSLTGGATPRGDLVISTRGLTAIGAPTRQSIRVGAGVSLLDLQRRLSSHGLYYPPVPTYEGAFVGGTVATNAAGAATFKYGSTRAWVDALTVVLASGEVLDLERGAVAASAEGVFEIVSSAGDVTTVAAPGYTMPAVAKLSAGYFAQPGIDLIDLFIGSEGTLGIVTAATLRVIAKPLRALALVRCHSEGVAMALTGALRAEAREAWAGRGPLDVAAIEYMDSRSLRALADDTFHRARVERPPHGAVLLLVQIELPPNHDATFERFDATLSACGIHEDPVLSAPGDDRGAERLFELREAVPAAINALVAAAQATDPAVEKTAADIVVPFEQIGASLALCHEAFGRRGLDHAVWGHASDGNLHPNLIPRSFADVERGREALLAIARGVIALGGAPLAEHGVGRSAIKQHMLRALYGEAGIDQMRGVKQALDPEWKLAQGVLFERPKA